MHIVGPFFSVQVSGQASVCKGSFLRLTGMDGFKSVCTRRGYLSNGHGMSWFKRDIVCKGIYWFKRVSVREVS